MAKLGYNYVNLDDCWTGPRDNTTGALTADSSRFPSGSLKPLADYLHSRQPPLKLGVYTDVGNFTCKNKRPGSWGHYQQDANTFAAWGVDLVKMDWCDHPFGKTAQELYTMMSNAMSKSGREMFFAMCGWGLSEPWTWGPKVANSWRVGPDHLPVWWTDATKQDPGQGQGTSNIIEHMANLSAYSAPGGWNDPDFLMTGLHTEGFFTTMSKIDWRTEFSFWSIFAAPLIVATDIRKVSSDKVMAEILLNEEAIAVNQDPLGIGGARVAKTQHGAEVWVKPLSNGTWAVILYNSRVIPFFPTVTVTLSIDGTHLPGWKSGNQAHVRDLWAHKDLGVVTGSFEAHLEPHDVRFVIVSAV